MPRTLPWAVDEPARPKQERRAKPARPQKRQKLIHHDSDDESTGGLQDNGSTSEQQPDRTPSTSPPPAPPTEDFMREGFDQDDVYIMVEDEFLATAQVFTQHLHFAEYTRIKKASKNAPPASIKALSRPTDSKTVMGEELKKKKQSEALSARQQAGLKETVAGRIDPASDEEETKEDDPWVGTSLQGLMTSPRKSQQALVGLERIKSSTRAAAGYSMVETPSPRKHNRSNDLLDITPIREKPRDTSHTAADASPSDYSDDLDSQAAAKRPVESRRTEQVKINHAPELLTASKKTSSDFPKSTKEAPHKPANSYRLSLQARMRAIDDFDEIFKNSEQVDERQGRPRKSPSRDEKSKSSIRDREKQKKARLDGIPLFMG